MTDQPLVFEKKYDALPGNTWLLLSPTADVPVTRADLVRG